MSILFGAAALQLHGQAFGTIGGTVADPTGEAIAGAKVTATEKETNLSLLANRTADAVSFAHFLIRPQKGFPLQLR